MLIDPGASIRPCKHDGRLGGREVVRTLSFLFFNLYFLSCLFLPSLPSPCLFLAVVCSSRSQNITKILKGAPNFTKAKYLFCFSLKRYSIFASSESPRCVFVGTPHGQQENRVFKICSEIRYEKYLSLAFAATIIPDQNISKILIESPNLTKAK